MDTDVDIDTACHRIQSCIDESSDALKDVEHNSEGQTVRWVVERGDYRYTVNRTGTAPSFQVRFGHNVAHIVASIISIEDAENLLSPTDVETDGLDERELKILAAEYLLDNAPDDIKQSFNNGLVQLMSHPGLYFEYDNTDSGAITHYSLITDIHPFSDDFRYREFDQAVQTVITIGHAATTFVQMSLDVQGAVESAVPAEVPYIH